MAWEVARHRQALAPYDDWGDTTSESGRGRRIYVTNIPATVQASLIIQYFGPKERLEGFRRRGKHIFIQYKQPENYSQAILKNGSCFMGRTLKVEEYKVKPRPSKPPPSHSSSNFRTEPRRRRSRTRSRTRSRSRSLSSEKSPPKREYRSIHHPVERSDVPIQSHSGVTSKKLFDEWHRPIEPADLVNQIVGSAIAQSPDLLGDIPQDIFILFQLMLMQKTAKNLSDSQLKSLIDFLESERIAVQNGVGTANQNGGAVNHHQPSNPQESVNGLLQQPLPQEQLIVDDHEDDVVLRKEEHPIQAQQAQDKIDDADSEESIPDDCVDPQEEEFLDRMFQ